MTTNYDHASAATSLHEVADFIGRLPADVPPPKINDESDRLTWYVFTAIRDERWTIVRTVPQQVRHIARALGGRWSKNDPEATDRDAMYYELNLTDVEVGGRTLRILCYRNDVCTPVQIGTETVQVEAKPAVEAHEEQRPVYRYDCKPLNDAEGRELADVLAELDEARA